MKELTNMVIARNKETFINLLRGALEKREGAKTEELITRLENSDFFEAPASVRYHGSYKGGLVEHLLKVRDTMIDLSLLKKLGSKVSDDSITIVGLLHDFYKRNFYESYFQNKKVYRDNGLKKDENGNYDWVSIPGYKVRENEDRFIFSSNGANSEFMIRQFIPLTYEESAAIINLNNGENSFDMKPEILERYPLLTLAFTADVLSCYINEE